MAGFEIKVECQLSDCLHYQQRTGPGMAMCASRDKPHHMGTGPCPLYRLDWQKKAAASENIIRMFTKR
jgi:hypothetical protein